MALSSAELHQPRVVMGSKGKKEVEPTTSVTQAAASVDVGFVAGGAVLEEQQRGKKKAKVRKQRRPRPKTHQKSPTHQRRLKRQVREERQVRQANESLTLSALDHDSAPVLVMKGVIDGRVCNDILVDPGATSNFVQRSWVQGQRMREQTLRVPLQVKLAVGQVPTRQLGGVAVKSAEVSGSAAPCVLVVMEHLSHQVILGMPWLRRAGVNLGIGEAMTWNGRKLRIHENGRVTVQLKAVMVKVDPAYKDLMAKLVRQYDRAFSKELRKRSPDQNLRAVQCKVTLKNPDCRPVCSKQRRRSPKDTNTLIACVREMEAAGLIVKGESPWSSQAVLVKKVREGVVLDEKRPCWDYRWVNPLIVRDAFSLPLPEDLFDKLQGQRIFSKMDLTKGFWQIPLEEASQKILAMDTSLGLYKPTSMPFGMVNAPAVFQREMQRVFKDKLYEGVMVFVDDILIYSKTAEEHAKLVEWVLKRLQDEGYYAHPDKCEFFQKEVSFLGHVVSEKGVSVQQHKVKAVAEWPQPCNKKDVRSFLGLCNYYRKFIAGFIQIAAPLTDLTRKDLPFVWEQRQQIAFGTLKERLTGTSVLAHPDSERPYIVTTDASGFAISGVLSQDQPDGSRRPVAYMSRKMLPTERRYATHDKELLAIVKAVDHWRCYLEGSSHPILLLSDHRSLQHLNTQPNLTDRQARWVEKLSDFEFRIEYLKGKLNGVADSLSRRSDFEAEAAAERAAADAKDLSDEPPRVRIVSATETVSTTDTNEQEEARPMWQTRIADFPLLSDIKQAAANDAVYQERVALLEPRTDGLTVGDELLWTCDGILYIPADSALQQLLIRQAHDGPTGGHMGVAKTMARLTSTCWWPGMKAMIADYVRGCTTCAATKSSLQKPARLLRPLPIPEKPWRMITIDFVGPLPRTPDYFNYILVVVDKFSKMAHFIPTTTNVTAEETAKMLLDHVVRLHGLPESMISDRGHKFTAHLFQELWKAMGTDLRLSTAYHPQSDGQTERVNRELEQQLRVHANRTGNNWKQWLSVVEMHYNSDRHESTGKTPYEMNGVDWRDQWAVAMASARPALRNDAAEDMLRDIAATWEDARQVMLRQREQQKKFADRSRRDERYAVDDQVMLSTDQLVEGNGKLRDRWIGPFKVAEVFDNGVNVRLDLPNQYKKLHPVFHVEKLKRFTPSDLEWPGRQQGKRPKARLGHGKKKYWAVRLIEKKEEYKEVFVPVEQDSSPAQAVEPHNAVDKEESKESGTVIGRRVSPREHASTRSHEAPVIVPHQGRKPKARQVKELRRIVSYKVEWEGYGPDDGTWKTEEELIDEGLEWMIRDYEMQLHQQDDELDLAEMHVFSLPSSPTDKVGLLRCGCGRGGVNA